MLKLVAFVSALLAVVFAEPVPGPNVRCDLKYPSAGLSTRYWEAVAHAVHSLDLQSLQEFNPQASEENHIPTVNLNLRDTKKVLENAPNNPVGHDFFTEEMNLIDRILSRIGKSDDGLGQNWTPVERIVHTFHMRDLWRKIKPVFDKITVDDKVCVCLLDNRASGVSGAVAWVANHYAHGTPITLLNRPIPKLTDANNWVTWKGRLLHYYNDPAIHDAAYYLKCALSK